MPDPAALRLDLGAADFFVPALKRERELSVSPLSPVHVAPHRPVWSRPHRPGQRPSRPRSRPRPRWRPRPRPRARRARPR
ncbi:MAG: hypothetical protein CMM85_07020 [Rhodothermaceae bacterium]|nr:hypothetical protein [Rhodothermaceae bacterium]